MANKLQIPYLEILLKVWEERVDELASAIADMTRLGHGAGAPHPEQVFNQIGMIYTNRLGELYEEVSNFRGAILWYERAVVFAKKRKPHVPDVYANPAIGRQYSNLALAQKRAGFLTKALENYNIAVPVDPTGSVQNREKLIAEIKEWTGSSGKLTPGC